MGAGVALLFAPGKGEETQAELRERAKKLRESAEERVREAQKTLEDRISTARDDLHGRVDKVKDAFEGTKMELIQSNLTAEQEATLREAFGEE